MVNEGGTKDGQVQPETRPSPTKKNAVVTDMDVAPSKQSPQRPSPTAVDDDIAVGAVLDGEPVIPSPAKKKAKTAKATNSTTASAVDTKSSKAAPKRRRATSQRAASEDADGAAHQA